MATGVHDDLPPVDGLADRWGKSVFNCPFCDGWEHRDQPVVVIDAAPGADHLAALLRSWTPHVTVVDAADVVSLTATAPTLSHVTLRDGRSIAASAAFVKAPVVPRSSIARALGCQVDDDGSSSQTSTGATSHPLVWAAGDVRRPPPMPHQVILAAADGSAAAIAIHRPSSPRLDPSSQRLKSRQRLLLEPPHSPPSLRLAVIPIQQQHTWRTKQHEPVLRRPPAQFQDQFDSRNIADVLAAAIVRPAIDDDAKAFIESRTFFFPQLRQPGGPPHRVPQGRRRRIRARTHPTTVVFPSYDGNGMFLSMGNIACDGRIGLLFMDFERPHRVRAHANAVVSNDDPMVEDYPGADLIVRATVTDVFVNCPR